MTNHGGFMLLSISVLLLFGSTVGLAEQASSFEQLQVLVQKGNQVSVSTGDGKVTKRTLTQYLRHRSAYCVTRAD
jgi:hypothetical protein